MADTRKRYRGTAVDVSFDALRCRHAAECLRGLPGVFDTGRRPWILPDGGAPEEVVRVVARCPTGALRAHATAAAMNEQPVTPTELAAQPGGPVIVRGDLRVIGPSGLDERETRAALCSCGSTTNAPYCDGSGTCADWPHPRGPQEAHVSRPSEGATGVNFQPTLKGSDEQAESRSSRTSRSDPTG